MGEVPEMVGRVARAMYEARHARMGTVVDNFEDWPLEYRVSYYADARAAIEALREPTEATIRAGGFVFPDNEDGYGPAGVWDAMIDAALNA